MKKTTLLLIFSTGILLFINPIYSRGDEKTKFGKVEMSELTMKKCPFDSSADAMVIADIGESYFDYLDQSGFVLMFDRLVRIKIFTKKGFEKADIEIPLYHYGQDEEQLVTLKAKTYNLVDGKIVETKVENESMFVEEVDAYWRNRKITFPSVKEGSVIELKYTIKSPFIANLRDWYFQDDIPVKWSEYEIRIPEFFHYSRTASGFYPFCINENTTMAKKITQLDTYTTGGGFMPQTTRSASTFDYSDYIYKLASKEIPAFREEPYTNTTLNYLLKIEFDYTGYQFPRNAPHNVNDTWEAIAETLDKDEDFGGQIRKTGIVKDLAESIRVKTTDSLELATLAYDQIRDMMKWNGFSSKYPTSGLRKAFQLKTGNSADINLLLVSVLRELGLKADPVVLSTRSHGLVQKPHPSIKKLNYVIALVRIGGKEFLLDATSRLRPFGMLSFECLNGEGMVAVKDRLQWVTLLSQEKNISMYQASMSISTEGEIAGTLDVSKSGYLAVYDRNFFNTNGEKKFSENQKEALKNWNVEELKWENMDNQKEALKVSYKVGSADQVQVNENMMYLNVLLSLGQNNNPFAIEKREYPVDFGCPVKDVYVFTYDIPQGYTVESLPESMKIALPEQAGTFRFMATASGNKISLNSQLQLNKSFFPQNEYETLRAFFNEVTKKHAQQIVLKKN